MKLKLYYRRFRSSIMSKWIVLLFDIMTVLVSYSLAYVIQFHSFYKGVESSLLLSTLAVLLTVNVLFFHLTHTYVGVLRYSSFVDISRIFISLSLAYGSLLIISLASSWTGWFIFPLRVILISSLLNFFLMASSRIVAKLLYELLSFNKDLDMYVLIYGARKESVVIAKALQANPHNNYRLAGFISDDPDMWGKVVMGNKVYPNDKKLQEVLEDKQIKAIVVAPSCLKQVSSSDIFEKLPDCDIKLLSVPVFNELKSFTNEAIELKQIQIEDLLGREPIYIDIHKIASHIEGKRVMITGAAGSIGSEIARQVAALNPYMLILVDQAETPMHNISLELQGKWRNLCFVPLVADVANWGRMESIFREYTPHYVFHAAAYKHVPMMEDNVPEAIQTNVLGSKNMADLAVKYRTDKFVFVSTDKAVNPTNVMGCSKRIAEIYIQSLARQLQIDGNEETKFVTTRFGNVLGSNGSVIPLFKEQIRKGGPVTVTHPDIIRYFMTIPEACRLVLEAGSMGEGGKIYVFDMGEPVRIMDLARRMIKLSGCRGVKIEISGLRPGEKLYEELLNVKEQTLATKHEKIMIAKVREYNFTEVQMEISKLIKNSYGYDSMQIVAMMKEIVPEFISKNSEYEILDTQKTEILERVI